MTRRILVVCVGNICRSPTAEILFRHYAPDTVVTSAGLSALSGEPMDATALAVLGEHGLDGSGHAARQLYAGLIDHADLILTMEQAHLDAIERDTPGVNGRIFLLDQWCGEQDIADPFAQPRAAFELAYQRIDAAVQAWLAQLHLL